MKKTPYDKVFFGVCGGIAANIGISSFLIRFIVAMLFFCSAMPVGIAYIILIFLMPEE